jgi:hypothetical protein
MVWAERLIRVVIARQQFIGHEHAATAGCDPCVLWAERLLIRPKLDMFLTHDRATNSTSLPMFAADRVTARPARDQFNASIASLRRALIARLPTRRTNLRIRSTIEGVAMLLAYCLATIHTRHVVIWTEHFVRIDDAGLQAREHKGTATAAGN